VAWGPFEARIDPSGATHHAVWLACGVVLALAGAWCVMHAFAGVARLDRFYTLSNGQRAPYGNSKVWMARRAVLALVAHSARAVSGVVECAPRVRMTRKGWRVDLRVAVQMEAPMADTVDAVDAAVRGALTHATALPIHDVRVHAGYALLRSPQQGLR